MLVHIVKSHMWVSLFLFVFVLFMYIHLQHQYKFHTGIQIYEADYISKSTFIETCSLKQPFVTPVNINVPSHRELNQLPSIDYNIKDIHDYVGNEPIDTISLNYNQTKILLDTDSSSHFYTCRNNDNDFIKQFQSSWDATLKPQNTIHSTYDVMFGSKYTKTPLFYHNASAKYLFIQGQPVKIQLYPYSSISTNEVIHDYENYEFWSNSDSDARDPTEFLLCKQHVLFIPPYCFYRIQFLNTDSIVCSAEYTTLLNAFAHSKHICLYIMQNQNTYVNILKPLQSTIPIPIPIPIPNTTTNTNLISIDTIDIPNAVDVLEKPIEKASKEMIKHLLK
jgi:hypothetical protein